MDALDGATAAPPGVPAERVAAVRQILDTPKEIVARLKTAFGE